jgi:hypothetical protein
MSQERDDRVIRLRLMMQNKDAATLEDWIWFCSLHVFCGNSFVPPPRILERLQAHYVAAHHHGTDNDDVDDLPDLC